MFDQGRHRLSGVTQDAELKRMRVHPDWQRQGRGRSMLHALEQRALDLGFRRLSLDTTERQVAARSLYTSSGYVPTPFRE
jgi:GNAT superfamily N-acetyltransferase